MQRFRLVENVCVEVSSFTFIGNILWSFSGYCTVVTMRIYQPKVFIVHQEYLSDSRVIINPDIIVEVYVYTSGG